MGMNWTEDDLRKPQVLVESAYGMGHPGTFHFRDLSQFAAEEVVRVLTGQPPLSPVNAGELAEARWSRSP